MTREQFMAEFGGIYEHSPWIAAAALARGLGEDADNADGLAARMAAEVDTADRDAKLALLRAHPDLAGKLALAGALGADSAQEQAGAGLDACTPDELARFTALNTEYTQRFGFPFIIAVRGLERAQILAEFERRAGNSESDEFAEAVEQVHRIARLRLHERFRRMHA